MRVAESRAFLVKSVRSIQISDRATLPQARFVRCSEYKAPSVCVEIAAGPPPSLKCTDTTPFLNVHGRQGHSTTTVYTAMCRSTGKTRLNR